MKLSVSVITVTTALLLCHQPAALELDRGTAAPFQNTSALPTTAIGITMDTKLIITVKEALRRKQESTIKYSLLLFYRI
jgi:hypothetical protein